MKALSIIRQEHRNLGMTLMCFEKLLSDVKNNQRVLDTTLFHTIIRYIDSFLFKFHHPKEDEYLFPALSRRHPASDALIQSLQQDHLSGAHYCQQLGETLAACDSDTNGFVEFHEAAKKYISKERQHMNLEETGLLPLAQEHLTKSDWEPIDFAFLKNDDPVFGDAPKQRFDGLSRLINNICVFNNPML